MWTIERNLLNRQVEQYRILNGPNPLTFKQVIDLWRSDHTQGTAFRMFTSLMLASSQFQAFRWETPVVDQARLDQEFEFVLVDSPGLNRQENSQPFDPQLNSAADGSQVIEFENLGRDCILVVPTRGPAGVNHCHLGSYLRTADQNDCLSLWQQVGDSIYRRIKSRPEDPVWLSTAGGGVAWLHIRLDDQPKYYHHVPYKTSR